MDERYEIRGELGKGGLGAVFRGYDRNLKREVAIKRILPGDDEEDREEALKQLTEEAGNLCALQHPHIVTVYDVGSDDDGPFVVMELLTGQTLEELIERGPLTWEDFRELAMQTQEALIAAQERQLVHRDIKPGNVMLTWLPSGKFQTKLVDFGLAKFSPKPTQQDIGKDDSVFGSIFFMAPEQFERKPLDARTDMYATGCVYYHALAGTYPFAGSTGQEVMQAHLEHRVIPLNEVREDIPRWASDWVMWHMNRDPDDRPVDARESLQQFIMSDQTPTQAQPAPEPAPKRPRLLIPGATGAEVPATPTAQAVPTQPVPAVPVQTQAAPVEPVQAQPVQAQPVQAQPVQAQPAPPTQAAPPAQAAAPMQAASATPEPVVAAAPAPPPPPPTPEPEPAIPAAAAEPPRPDPMQTSPQPLQPPAGSKPSVHSAARKATSQIGTQTTDIPTVALTPAQAKPGTTLHAAAEAVPLATAQAVTAAPPGTLIGEAHKTRKRKKLNPAAAAAIAAVLGLLAVLLGYLLLVRMGENKKAAAYNALVAQAKEDGVTEIPVNEKQLNILLDAASSISANRERETIYQCLYLAKSTDGTDIDLEIAKHATTEIIADDILIKLFKVLELRGNPVAIPMLLDFVSKSNKVTLVSAALEACKKMATDDHFPAFLDVLETSGDANVRRAAEATISEIIERSENREQLAQSINSAYQRQLDETTKLSLLRLLGYTGSDSARDLVSEALKSEDPLERQSAILAIGNWPDDSMFEVLIEFLETTKDDQFRKRSFDTAFKYLRYKKRDRAPEDLEDLWKMLASNAKTNREQIEVINGVVRAEGEWRIAVIEYFVDEAEDDRVIDEAEKAIAYIKERQKIQGSDEEEE